MNKYSWLNFLNPHSNIIIDFDWTVCKISFAKYLSNIFHILMCFGSVFGQIILIFSFMLCIRHAVQVILETYSNQTHTNISSLVLAAYKKNPPNFKNIKYLSREQISGSQKIQFSSNHLDADLVGGLCKLPEEELW